MKTLTLLRHAKSGWDEPAMRDFDRPLNTKGERAAQAVGRDLRTRGCRFDHVVASPAVRVMETIEHVERGFGRSFDPHYDRRIYLASAEALLDTIRSLPIDAEAVMMVGHNPGLEDLVLLLVPATSGGYRSEVLEKFPTASVAVLRFAGAWADVAPGTAEFHRFVRPRDLDPALGPDAD